MPVNRWKEVIDLKAFYHDDLSIENVRDKTVEAIKASSWYKNFEEKAHEPSLFILVDDFAEAEDYQDFDYFMGLLYDLADRDRIWIATF